MSKLLVGVIGSGFLVNRRYAVQLVGEKNLRAVAQVADALPLMFGGASDLADIGPLLDTVDGILLTGDRANVHPSHFNAEPHPSHEPYDQDRDEVALSQSQRIETGAADGTRLFDHVLELPADVRVGRVPAAGEDADFRGCDSWALSAGSRPDGVRGRRNPLRQADG